MYYLEDQDPILVKKEVILDEIRLKKLYQEVLAKFGNYEHRSYDGLAGPYQTPNPMMQEFRYVKNYSETPAGDGLTHFEYDEYAVPELASAITRLIGGDASAIDELKAGPVRAGGLQGAKAAAPKDGRADGKGSVPGSLLRDQQRQRQKELQKKLQELLGSDPDEIDGESFRKLSDQIRLYYCGDGAEERKEQEEQRKELAEYYQKALDCISMKPVLTLYKDKLNELNRIWQDVRTFYEGTDQLERLWESMGPR